MRNTSFYLLCVMTLGVESSFILSVIHWYICLFICNPHFKDMRQSDIGPIGPISWLGVGMEKVGLTVLDGGEGTVWVLSPNLNYIEFYQVVLNLILLYGIPSNYSIRRRQ